MVVAVVFMLMIGCKKSGSFKERSNSSNTNTTVTKNTSLNSKVGWDAALVFG